MMVGLLHIVVVVDTLRERRWCQVAINNVWESGRQSPGMPEEASSKKY